MPIFREDGIAISHTAGARQLVILSHGGWKMKKSEGSRSGDGWLFAPANSVIHFYTLDKQFTLGNRVFTDVMADANAAYSGTLDAGRFPYQEQVSNQKGCKDYALYIDDRPAAASYWRDHAANVAGPSYNPDVDLAVIEVDSHKRHMTDVFALAAANGVAYERYHCGFCRVAR